MTTQEIAQLLGGTLQGDGTRKIRGVASLESAGPDELAFAEGARALRQAAGCRAGCILAAVGTSLPGQTTLTVSRPKLAFIRAAAALQPLAPFPPGIHRAAIIAPDAQLAANVSVGAHVVVESRVQVGARTRLGAGVFLGEGVRVGEDCIFHPRVTVYAGASIGNRVILHSGVVVGSDGFGYVFAEGRHVKFPQLGQLIIEDDVEIGSNSTLDRGSLGTTLIGAGTKIDNLVQIAHNVRIGRHCVIAAQTGISGSVEVGDFVFMGGQVGVGDRARIGHKVVIGGQAGILPGKTLRKGVTVWGTPARPLAEFKRIYANLSHLSQWAQKLKELSKKFSNRTTRDRPA